MNKKIKQIKRIKERKGITLVALVITIIILLLLAGISIQAITETGLFAKAEAAKSAAEIASIKEAIGMDIYEKQLQPPVGEITEGELKSILLEYGSINYEEDRTTILGITTEEGYNILLADVYTGEIVISESEKEEEEETEKTPMENAIAAMPAGASIDPNTNENTGIVMIDSNDNEWVWIEVPKTVFTIATSATDYDNIKADLIEYAKDYRHSKYADEWYDYYGTTYDGANEYSQVKYITSSDNFTNAKNYYGTIYTDEGSTPVESYTEGVTYYAKITDKTNDTSGCGLTYAEYNTAYQTMLSSIYTNKGFYISRYEAGIAGSDTNISLARTSHETITESSPEAVSKVDMIPYNYVYCSESQTLASAMSTGTKTSSLLFGIQWDLVCKFLEIKGDWDTQTNTAQYYIKSDSTSWGNYTDSSLTLTRGMYSTDYGATWKLYNEDTESYVTSAVTATSKSILLTTGASEETNKMNIYDFAGNEWEWTLEHASTNTDSPCSGRGGNYNNNGSNYPASYRGNNNTSNSGNGIGCRVSLY